MCQADIIQGLCCESLRGWHFLCKALAYIPHLPSRVYTTGTMSLLVWSTPLPLNTYVLALTKTVEFLECILNEAQQNYFLL